MSFRTKLEYLSATKAAIKAAIQAKGVSVSDSDTFRSYADKIATIETEKHGYMNAATVSGSYATSTYYNTTFGVKYAYLGDDAVVILMRGGTSTAYEHLRFSDSSLPSGVTAADTESTNFASGSSDSAGYLYARIYRGFDPAKKYNVAIALNTRNSSYDYVQCAVTITQA